jgi:hypothetical protein
MGCPCNGDGYCASCAAGDTNASGQGGDQSGADEWYED